MCLFLLLLFFIVHVSFSRRLLEREREVTAHTELYFYGMNGRYNANFKCRSIARGYSGVHMNLDCESMKRILIRAQQFDKAQCNNKQHTSIRFSTKNII
jgi:hypothetical protein